MSNATLDIGQRIKSHREMRAWSQREMAEKMGIPQPQVADWERGARSPSFRNLQRIADVFGLKLEKLLKSD